MAQLILVETKVFVTNHARHESPVTTSLGFGTAVFTGSGVGEFSPGTKDLLVVNRFFLLTSPLSFLLLSLNNQ